MQIRLTTLSRCLAILGCLALVTPGPAGHAWGQVSTQDFLRSMLLAQPKIAASNPLEVTAVFDPPAVRPGAKAVLRIGFNALEETIQWDGKLPAVENLEVQPGGKGQVLEMGSTNLEPRTSFLFHAIPAQAGNLVVPAFTVTVAGQQVQVPAATLKVSPDASPARPQELLVEIATTNIYVGQAVPVRIISPGVLQGLTQVQLTGEGFIVDQTSARQRVETLRTAQGAAPAYIYEVLLTPITAGKLSLLAQAYTIGSRFTAPAVLSGSITFSSSTMQYTLIDSEPAAFRVKPLPRAGQLPGFTGNVGSYTVDPPKLATTELRVGDPVRMTVLVRGQGALSRLVPPPLPRLTNWQVFLGTNDNLPPQLLQAQGFTRIHFNLLPTSDQVRETPSIPFSCFDPEKGTYVDLTIPPIPVRVQSGTTAVDFASLAEAESSAQKEQAPVLSGLAVTMGVSAGSLTPLQLRPWFRWVQMAPAVLFLALWGWDRRRRYLEKHPDILLRRKARRALRRERHHLRSAARAGDAHRFVTAAANGFRVACAPHYPAEPRALVCADVLPLLPPADRESRLGQTVREVFEISDASRFAPGAKGPANWLDLRPEIESVFEKLREKL